MEKSRTYCIHDMCWYKALLLPIIIKRFMARVIEVLRRWKCGVKNEFMQVIEGKIYWNLTLFCCVKNSAKSNNFCVVWKTSNSSTFLTCKFRLNFSCILLTFKLRQSFWWNFLACKFKNFQFFIAIWFQQKILYIFADIKIRQKIPA